MYPIFHLLPELCASIFARVPGGYFIHFCLCCYFVVDSNATVARATADGGVCLLYFQLLQAGVFITCCLGYLGDIGDAAVKLPSRGYTLLLDHARKLHPHFVSHTIPVYGNLARLGREMIRRLRTALLSIFSPGDHEVGFILHFFWVVFFSMEGPNASVRLSVFSSYLNQMQVTTITGTLNANRSIE